MLIVKISKDEAGNVLAKNARARSALNDAGERVSVCETGIGSTEIEAVAALAGEMVLSGLIQYRTRKTRVVAPKVQPTDSPIDDTAEEIADEV
jgi:hypothetical protein